MALLEISTAPLGTGSTSVSDYVANIIKIVKDSGLPFKLTDMGTIIEGDINELFELAKKIHEAPFNMNAKRVYTVIKIDDRRDKKVKLDEKVQVVMQKI